MKHKELLNSHLVLHYVVQKRYMNHHQNLSQQINSIEHKKISGISLNTYTLVEGRQRTEARSSRSDKNLESIVE